jgi:acyl-CoA thioesterase
MRKVDMTQRNSTKHPSDWTNINIYRPIGIISLEDYNLNACAHIYASDRNSLYIVSNAVGFGDEVGTMGSLSHSVVLHVSSKELPLKTGEWWIQEAWTPRSGQGRGMHESRIWDSTGKHIASSWQEGMVRRAESTTDQKQRLYWEEGMRRRAALMGEETRKEGLGKHKL